MMMMMRMMMMMVMITITSEVHVLYRKDEEMDNQRKSYLWYFNFCPRKSMLEYQPLIPNHTHEEQEKGNTERIRKLFLKKPPNDFAMYV
ncbi:Phosphatidate Phosphatase Lpin1 [Manis pentadactyla]|nr:Phosphatidate Phosphatase Lpin1 [Manis pentadactyla]